jgi:hypothetical protein
MSRTVIEISLEGWVFRWAGDSFIAAWKADRADEHVPDDMIQVPFSVNRSQATRQDIRQVVQRWRDGNVRPRSTEDLLGDVTALQQAVAYGQGVSLDHEHAQAVIDAIVELQALREAIGQVGTAIDRITATYAPKGV